VLLFVNLYFNIFNNQRFRAGFAINFNPAASPACEVTILKYPFNQSFLKTIPKYPPPSPTATAQQPTGQAFKYLYNNPHRLAVECQSCYKPALLSASRYGYEF